MKKLLCVLLAVVTLTLPIGCIAEERTPETVFDRIKIFKEICDEDPDHFYGTNGSAMVYLLVKEYYGMKIEDALGKIGDDDFAETAANLRGYVSITQIADNIILEWLMGKLTWKEYGEKLMKYVNIIVETN